MERIFKQVIEILNQNQVYHSVNQEDISKTDFCMVDVYSVNATEEAKKLGGQIEIVSYVRFEVGEGLEKKAEDFAAEVAAQMA